MTLREATNGGIVVEKVTTTESISMELDKRNAKVCPKCGDIFIVNKGTAGNGSCPVCGNAFTYWIHPDGVHMQFLRMEG